MLNNQEVLPTSKWILEDNNTFLSKKCKPVTFPLDKKDIELVNKMVSYIDACYLNKDEQYGIRPGIALAGPQVGCDKRIIYIHFGLDKKEYRYLLANPKIIATSVQKCYLKDYEGCLSVKKEHKGHVARYYRVKVEAIDMLNNNKKIVIDATDILSICLQHEIDHLDGILYYQRIDKNHKDLSDDQTLIAF